MVVLMVGVEGGSGQIVSWGSGGGGVSMSC